MLVTGHSMTLALCKIYRANVCLTIAPLVFIIGALLSYCQWLI